MSVKGLLQDRPAVITASSVLLVAAHATATGFSWLPNVWAPLMAPGVNLELVTSIYLSILGPASIVAGFAGVVIVFGLSPESARFRRFRLKAGDSLKRTWASTALSGFEAAFAGGVAAVLAAVGLVQAAPWVFELSVLWLAHGALRLVWILRGLIQTVHADDVEVQRKTSEVPLEQFGFKKAG